MELLSKKERPDDFGVEKLYYFKKFETAGSIIEAFNTMQNNGYILNKLTIHTDYDHTMDNVPKECTSVDELSLMIGKIDIVDIKDIFFECSVNGQSVSGKLAPDAGLIKFYSFYNDLDLEVNEEQKKLY